MDDIETRGPGSLVHHPEGTSGCLKCGWRGVALVHDGEKVNECPSCEVAAQTDEEYAVLAAKPKNVGRNDPCWCGSGKKAKKCHLR